MQFGVKFKLNNAENARQMLKAFQPIHIKEYTAHHEFFKVSDDEFRILINTDGKLTCLSSKLKEDGSGFELEENPTADWDKTLAQFKKKYQYEIGFSKECVEYKLKDILCRFCKVGDMGNFLEVETDNGSRGRILEFARKIGLDESQILNVPYNELFLKKAIKAQKRF